MEEESCCETGEGWAWNELFGLEIEMRMVQILISQIENGVITPQK